MDSLKTEVKVGEINNLSDARFCAAMGVPFLGFLMAHPERKSLSKEEFVAISQWLEGPELVGEFFDAEDQFILDLNQEIGFSAVQTNNLDQAKRLISKGIEVFFISKESGLKMPENILYLILDEGYSSDPSEYSSHVKVLCGYGLNKDSLEGIISDTNFAGIHLKGSDELRPGYKNFDELADVLELISQ